MLCRRPIRIGKNILNRLDLMGAGNAPFILAWDTPVRKEEKYEYST